MSAVRTQSTLVMLAMPVLLGGLYWVSFPFPDTLTARKICTSALSRAQKANIQLAATAVDGKVLKPGEEFSFNKVVGDRTCERGYKVAPSYLGPDSPATPGGGVCVVSSALYQAALETGCEVTERVAHTRTIRTVPPGLDAAVWYGQADLRFRNTTGSPVQIRASADSSALTVTMLGSKSGGNSGSGGNSSSDDSSGSGGNSSSGDSSGSGGKQTLVTINTTVTRSTSREVAVLVTRRQGGKDYVISRDLYLR